MQRDLKTSLLVANRRNKPKSARMEDLRNSTRQFDEISIFKHFKNRIHILLSTGNIYQDKPYSGP